MLPELLFSVGNSMQDISRDDFNLLNGECVVDKDCVIIRSSSTNSAQQTSQHHLPVISASTSSSINPSITPTPPPQSSSSVSNIIVDAYNVCSSSSSSQLHRNNTKSPNLESDVSIKIEETNNSDLYNNTSPWHHHHHHHHHHSHLHATDKPDKPSKLLLRNSDDPLISRGATSVDDDNPNELKSIMMVSNSPINHNDITDATEISITDTITTDHHQHHHHHHHIQRSPLLVKKNRSSNVQGQQTRTRRKGAFKLRFHHQALPPEYLSHYEATQNQINIKQNNIINTANFSLNSSNNNNNNNNNNKINSNSSSKHTDGDILSKKSNVVALTSIKPNDKNLTNSQENVRNWLQKIAEMQEAAAAKEAAELAIAAETTIGTSIIEPIDIHDEIDQICEVHSVENNNLTKKDNVQVINKPSRIVNYSDLPYMGEMTLENSKPRRGRKPKKADICHLIYKNYGTIFPGTPKDLCSNENDKSATSILAKKLTEIVRKESNAEITVLNEEPLNLCLRDQSDSYTISSDDDDSVNDFETLSNVTPHEIISDSITDNLLAKNLKLSLSNFKTASSGSTVLEKLDIPHRLSSNIENDKTSTSNCGQYDDAHIFMHPVALYYQKMIDSNNTPQSPSQSNSPSTPTTSTTSLSVKLPSPSPKSQSKSPSMQIKKEKSERPDTCSTPSSVKSGISLATTNCGSSSNNTQPPQKRKRSAIFIPPMPAENTTNPPTEVSICKFKFTGGAKPTLQEKKMLSVDSEGNYRYFSGTGDKSSRGYEFFPRESLQQSGVIPGVNCSGAFLNATGEKISTDLPPPSAGLSNELLQIPDTPPSALLLPSAISSSLRLEHHHRSNCSHDRKKRKSKRSIQREKLEQTFKDKGFLIQTQQLESAEGATYCKFRQLKKFTRYLFRSWKDYLPGDVQHAQAAAAAAALVTGSSNGKSLLTSHHQSAAIESIRNHVESNMNKTTAANTLSFSKT